MTPTCPNTALNRSINEARRNPFAVLRYQLARFPLQLIEDRLMVRLSAEAPARLLYERSVGTLDAIVGRLLGDADLQKRDAALVERSDVLGLAAQLGASATQTRQQADEKSKSISEDVVSDINEARDAAEQKVVEARLTAEKQKQAADHEAKSVSWPQSSRPIRRLLSAQGQRRRPSGERRPTSRRPKK